MRVTVTQQGPYKRLVLVEIRNAFMEQLRLQARAEGTTPARLIEDALLSIVPAPDEESAARNRRYS